MGRQQGHRIHHRADGEEDRSEDLAGLYGFGGPCGSDEQPLEPLDAAIIFAPVGALVPAALKAVRKGGRVICGGIHMSDIPSFRYALLWEERQVASVANLTREDAREFCKSYRRPAYAAR